jgi:K+-sensing histidine kinase KdpD
MAEDVVFDRAAIEESVTMIAEDLGRLRDHIENLLSLAQLEAGAWSPNPEWVEVSELASVALRLLPAADRERVRLAGAGGSVLVHVDVSQLSQVLRHLVENALIYSPPETAVDVRVASDDSRVRIMVEDHGPGISPEEARRVFRKFYRGEAARRSAVRGTGLGLAICKEIVSAHHGEIRVERNEGGGARLVVELPAEAPPVVQNED